MLDCDMHGDEVDLIVSKEKTKVIPIGNTPANVTDKDGPIEAVDSFCYLGINATPLNSVDHDWKGLK